MCRLASDSSSAGLCHAQSHIWHPCIAQKYVEDLRLALDMHHAGEMDLLSARLEAELTGKQETIAQLTGSFEAEKLEHLATQKGLDR